MPTADFLRSGAEVMSMVSGTMNTASAEATGEALPPAAATKSIYRSGTLWLLLAVSTMNFLDRTVASVLAEPMRRDLHLTDTQVGLMTGLAFAIFYTLVGIPIARYSDRFSTSRPRVLAGALILWSAMTALCGMAQNFAQLMLARIGVGAGEAGCTPPSHSLISDLYPGPQRTAAMAFYGLGLPFGSMLGMSLGGLFADWFGWRVSFMLCAVPGIIFGLATWAFAREPRREAHFASESLNRQAVPMGEVLREVAQSRTFLFLLAAMSIGGLVIYGKTVWQAVFMIRVLGATPGQAGLALGGITLIGSLIGASLASYASVRLGRANRRHILTIVWVGQLIAAPFSLLGYWADSWMMTALWLLVPAMITGVFYGPVFSCLQGLVRPASRGAAVAVFLLIQNLVGLGLGPMLFGILSDALQPAYGIESVRYVLLASVAITPIPVLCFWAASRNLDRELKD